MGLKLYTLETVVKTLQGIHQTLREILVAVQQPRVEHSRFAPPVDPRGPDGARDPSVVIPPCSTTVRGQHLPTCSRWCSKPSGHVMTVHRCECGIEA